MQRYKTLTFIVTLAANTPTNYTSMYVVLPIQIMKKPDNNTAVDAIMIIVNNFSVIG